MCTKWPKSYGSIQCTLNGQIPMTLQCILKWPNSWQSNYNELKMVNFLTVNNALKTAKSVLQSTMLLEWPKSLAVLQCTQNGQIPIGVYNALKMAKKLAVYNGLKITRFLAVDNTLRMIKNLAVYNSLRRAKFLWWFTTQLEWPNFYKFTMQLKMAKFLAVNNALETAKSL